MAALHLVTKASLTHGGGFPWSREQKLLALLRGTRTGFVGPSKSQVPPGFEERDTDSRPEGSRGCMQREMDGPSLESQYQLV